VITEGTAQTHASSKPSVDDTATPASFFFRAVNRDAIHDSLAR